jgi:scyllo-inositol 2-dehydrogenase (NADP+)
MLAPIRTAVFGYGLAGRVFHCPFISAVPGLELAAIVQRTGDAAAIDYPATRILRTIDEALTDVNIDLVVVGTPNDTHFDLAKRALLAGKHVVVDKPITATSAEARELINLARQQGKVLAPFHNRRFDGDFLTLRKLIEEKTLGRITQISSHFDRFRPFQRANTWKESAGPANSLLFDLGPHLLDQALALFGTPTHITASIRSERDTTAIQDAFDIVLDYIQLSSTDNTAKPLRYSCHSTMIAADPAPRFRIHGTLGSFTKYGLDPQEPTLIAGTRPPQLGSSAPWLMEPESSWGTLAVAGSATEASPIHKRVLQTYPGDYRLFYASVRNAILGNAPLAIPAEDGFRAIKLLELALQSSAEQRTLPVNLSE